MKHRLKWFIDRIGKNIYHKKGRCKCWCCQKTYVEIWDGVDEKGKQISERDFRARYLFSCQNSLDIEYFDKPIKGQI